ncbi:MAG: hypothetical protein IJY78_05940 [Bacteroidaceae bacterium]|nr:hypothetical protein [Bacteroidaceae bacterium]
MESILSLVPRLEVFALPDSRERATQKPHAIRIANIYIRTKPSEYPEDTLVAVVYETYETMGIYRCYVLCYYL